MAVLDIVYEYLKYECYSLLRSVRVWFSLSKVASISVNHESSREKEANSNMNELVIEKAVAPKAVLDKGRSQKNNQQLMNQALKSICEVRERSDSALIKVQSLAYMVVQRPNIEEAAQFFVNFGLLIDHRSRGKIFLRGKSCESHIIILEKGKAAITRLGFTASESDVQKLAKHKKLSIQHRLNDCMGGSYVSLNDPDGVCLEINHGINKLTALNEEAPLSEWNAVGDIKRVNDTVRNTIEPRVVEKLGHTLWGASYIKKTVHWYQDTLGLIVSDFQLLKGDTLPNVAFMRCDCGDQASDHHSIGFGIMPEVGHNHTAFEMNSFEDIAIANKWLSTKHYRSVWGIGRHILGSQIFDYWRDPHGDMFEHYADGDLFTSDLKTGYHYFNKYAQHQWGPDMSEEFKGTTRPIKIGMGILKRLFSRDDLKISRLLKLLKYS